MNEQTQKTTSIDDLNAVNWQALSPWSIVSFVIGSIKTIATNGYALIPIVYAGWQNDVSLFWVIDGVLVLIVLLSSFAFVQWRKFRYRITDQQLDVQRGLFFTKKDEIPLSRIQNIRFEQPFYFKPLKLAILVIETAGSSKDEAKLTALDVDKALKLKQHLLQLTPIAHAKDDSFCSEDQTQLVQESHPIVKRSFADLVLFGFYQNNFIWFAIIAGPIAGQIDWEQIVKSPLFQQSLNWISQLTHNNFMLQIGLFFGLLICGYLLFSLISVVSSVLKYYPYSLDKHQQTLHRSGGVIAHQQDALAIKRVQVIHFQQPLLASLFDRWTIFLKQVKGNEVEERTKQHMLIPSIKSTEVEAVFEQLADLSREKLLLPNHYQGIHIAWFYKRAWLAFIPAVFISAAYFIMGLDIKLVELAFIGAIIATILLYIRYKRWGFVIEDQVVWQHTGLLARNWKRIPFDKIQHVKVTQTATQKKQRLAYLELGLASGAIILPYIPIEIVDKLVANSLNEVAKKYHQWI
ncbi:PH domain-containing protein [Shewanella aestuarii]|uniref:PH domain-containing protein n=1 Tax=Shewanella aestuarii TaxID=1028752 RepID=A0A6G9QGT8_9GAMM|nr:PH domain-containing protein [Shewanella aestuarii]QIR13764.1 PH domain-containing protein [Shewanella aestuarii]